MEGGNKFFAFISYKREDRNEASKLQHFLEYYRLPNHLRKERAELPEFVRPIFRDLTDLEVGELSPQIHAALDQSQFLIVVCSPRAVKSKWVDDEVKYFISIGKADRIIPYIIDGYPISNNPDEECYPPSLLSLSKEMELLGANINEVGRGPAIIRIVSRMFNIRFDTLYQRYRREQIKHRRNISIAVISTFLGLFGVACWIWHQNIILKERERSMMENQARSVAEKANQLTNDGDSYLSTIITLEMLTPSRPYVPEVEVSLRNACLFNNAVLHTKGEIWSVALSPDGNYIVGGDINGKILIWDARDGALLKDLDAHSELVSSISFSPDGYKFVSSSEDNTIKIWDLNNVSLQKTLNGHTGNVYSAYYDKSGKEIISASADSTIKIWDVQTGEILHSIKETVGFVNYANFCPEETNLLEISTDGYLRIRDIKTGILIKELQINESFIESASYCPNGRNLIATSYNGYIKIWDSQTFEEKSNYFISRNLRGAFYSTDGARIIAYYKDTISIIIPENGYVERVLQKHRGYIHDVSISLDSKQLVSASEDNTIRVWDLEEHKGVVFDEKGHFFDVSFKDGGNTVLARILENDDPLICLWNSSTGKYIKTCMEIDDCVGEMTISNSGKYLAISNDGIFGNTPICLYEIDSGDYLYMLDGSYDDVRSISFSPDGKKIISVLGEDQLCVWDVTTGSLLKKIDCSEFHSDFVIDACFSHDNKIIITSSADNTIGLIDADSYQLINKMVGHEGNVIKAISNRGSNLLYSASSDNTIKIWDMRTGECKITIPQNNIVHTISLSYDDKWLVSGGDDKYVRVWNSETGDLVCVYDGHEDGLSSVEFCPDNKHILSFSLLDNKVVVWEFKPLQEIIKENLIRFKGRKLTPEERKQTYLE